MWDHLNYSALARIRLYCVPGAVTGKGGGGVREVAAASILHGVPILCRPRESFGL